MLGTTRGAEPYGAACANRVHARRCGGAKIGTGTPPSKDAGPDAATPARARSHGVAAVIARFAKNDASRARDVIAAPALFHRVEGAPGSDGGRTRTADGFVVIGRSPVRI
jgi:hypothetical protein